uniref:C2H2-type domain-containing protein n=1 Tax=Glossina austeni TaxID=7395 RepID=A0A1A9VFS9_GLOAU
MGESGYQMNDPSEADTIDLSFISRTEFSNSDVERVLLESEESILNSIEQISDCHDSSAFLSPMNDILGDLNEFGKSFYSDQSGSSQQQQSQQVLRSAISCSWPGQREAGFINLPMPTTYANINQDIKIRPSLESVSIYDMETPPGHSALTTEIEAEFTTSDCTYIGPEYPSNLNQWLFNSEQQKQQVAYMSPSTQSMSHLCGVAPLSINAADQVNPNYSANFLNTVQTYGSSIVSLPIPMEDNFFTSYNMERNFSAEKPSAYVEDVPTTKAAEVACNAFHKDFEDKPESSVQMQWKFGSNFQISSNNVSNNSSTSDEAEGRPGLNAPLPFRSLGQQMHMQRKDATMRRNLSEVPQQQSLANVFDKNGMHWGSIFPHNHLIQPPEMVVMHPLRTRKSLASKRISSLSTTETVTHQNSTDVINCSQDNPASLSGKAVQRNENAERDSVEKDCDQTIYLFDDFSNFSNFSYNITNIPMIKERSRSENRSKNRRKQKLQIIPGSENVIFEIQHAVGNVVEDIVPIQAVVEDHVKETKNEGAQDPYSEMELPELDEIFRRKKKPAAVVAIGSKRNYQITQPVAQPSASIAKKIYRCVDQSPPIKLQESSASFEEKISVPIAVRKARSYLAVSKSDWTYSTDSDSEESVRREDQTPAAKSFKCTKCKKIFKTTRSLAIHTKRCIKSSHQDKSDILSIVLAESKSNGESNTNESSKTSSDELQSLSILNDGGHPQCNNLLPKIANSQVEESLISKHKPRPITRSQTRRSTGRSISYTGTKRSK